MFPGSIEREQRYGLYVFIINKSDANQPEIG